MIDEFDIEQKTLDFSISFPGVIRKIRAISRLITATGDQPDQCWVGQEELLGIGSILEDAVDDLETINRALYGEGRRMVFADGQEKAPEIEPASETSEA